MSKIHHTLIGVCVAAASLSVMAQAADEHKAHHPAGSTQPASTQMKTSAQSQWVRGRWLEWPRWTSI